MSPLHSFIGAGLREPATLSVWLGIGAAAFGILHHAFGTETMGLILVVAGMFSMMNGVAEKAASEAVERERQEVEDE